MIDTKKLRELCQFSTYQDWVAASTPAVVRALLDELDRVTAENEALKKDAERYWYLIATCNIEYEPSEPWQLVIWEPNTGENWKAKLDSAIDAAIRASKGEA